MSDLGIIAVVALEVLVVLLAVRELVALRRDRRKKRDDDGE